MVYKVPANENEIPDIDKAVSISFKQNSIGEFVLDETSKACQALLPLPRPAVQVSRSGLKQTFNLVDRLRDRGKLTPDFGSLRVQKWIPVFVYDHMKSNHTGKYMLDGAEFLGEGRTVASVFIMRGKPLPVVFKADSTSFKEGGVILGEVYAVPPEGILHLDNIKRNNLQHRRELITVSLMDQPYEGKKKKIIYPTVKCFMYLGVESHWKATGRMQMYPRYEPSDKRIKHHYFEYDGDATRTRLVPIGYSPGRVPASYPGMGHNSHPDNNPPWEDRMATVWADGYYGGDN